MARKETFEAKILVLDDERLIRMTVCARLKKAGYGTVAVASVEEAVALLKKHHRSFCAIISDIMMGDMDGFVFRDIVRGLDPSIPFFFMTALDPEEGSGFLKRIIGDPMCYYLPKSAGSEVLIKRLQRVVVARHIQQFVEKQVAEQRKSLTLAAQVQKSMLPPRAMMNDRCYYTTMWRPHESVSGDFYEAMPVDADRMLFSLGDIQGHGANAALVMMAVQAFMRQVMRANAAMADVELLSKIANELHAFFQANFAEVSYMTAIFCIYTPPPPEKAASRGGSITYLTCGAPDLRIFDPATGIIDFNRDSRGGLPIGLMPDSEYTDGDIIQAQLPPNAFCAAFTDGIYEMTKDVEGQPEHIPNTLVRRIAAELAADACNVGAIMPVIDKFAMACSEFGYNKVLDDMTVLLFGPRHRIDGIYEATLHPMPTAVDAAAQACADWCTAAGWPEDLVTRIQLVLEEHLMNVYDHGLDAQQQRKEVVSIRLRRRMDNAELTVWDAGRPPPTIKVAAGDADTAFDLANMKMDDHGRGRLMVRQLCHGIQRQRFGKLNETIFYIPWNANDKEETK
jgi:sigma-B regulation protein RsbU (phosphoserine phosphatase)